MHLWSILGLGNKDRRVMKNNDIPQILKSIYNDTQAELSVEEREVMRRAMLGLVNAFEQDVAQSTDLSHATDPED